MQVYLEPSLGSSLARTSLRSVFSAQANSIAIYPTPAQPSNPPADSAANYVYLAQYESSHLERRELKVASYTIWASLQVSRQFSSASRLLSRLRTVLTSSLLSNSKSSTKSAQQPGHLTPVA